MKYGIPILAEFNSIEENVKYAKENNLDFIEINMDLLYCLIINNLQKYGIDLTCIYQKK